MSTSTDATSGANHEQISPSGGERDIGQPRQADPPLPGSVTVRRVSDEVNMEQYVQELSEIAEDAKGDFGEQNQSDDEDDENASDEESEKEMDTMDDFKNMVFYSFQLAFDNFQKAETIVKENGLEDVMGPVVEKGTEHIQDIKERFMRYDAFCETRNTVMFNHMTAEKNQIAEEKKKVEVELLCEQKLRGYLQSELDKAKAELWAFQKTEKAVAKSQPKAKPSLKPVLEIQRDAMPESEATDSFSKRLSSISQLPSRSSNVQQNRESLVLIKNRSASVDKKNTFADINQAIQSYVSTHKQHGQSLDGKTATKDTLEMQNFVVRSVLASVKKEMEEKPGNTVEVADVINVIVQEIDKKATYLKPQATRIEPDLFVSKAPRGLIELSEYATVLKHSKPDISGAERNEFIIQMRRFFEAVGLSYVLYGAEAELLPRTEGDGDELHDAVARAEAARVNMLLTDQQSCVRLLSVLGTSKDAAVIQFFKDVQLKVRNKELFPISEPWRTLVYGHTGSLDERQRELQETMKASVKALPQNLALKPHFDKVFENMFNLRQFDSNIDYMTIVYDIVQSFHKYRNPSNANQGLIISKWIKILEDRGFKESNPRQHYSTDETDYEMLATLISQKLDARHDVDHALYTGVKKAKTGGTEAKQGVANSTTSAVGKPNVSAKPPDQKQEAQQRTQNDKNRNKQDGKKRKQRQTEMIPRTPSAGQDKSMSGHKYRYCSSCGKHTDHDAQSSTCPYFGKCLFCKSGHHKTQDCDKFKAAAEQKKYSKRFYQAQGHIATETAAASGYQAACQQAMMFMQQQRLVEAAMGTGQGYSSASANLAPAQAAQSATPNIAAVPPMPPPPQMPVFPPFQPPPIVTSIPPPTSENAEALRAQAAGRQVRRPGATTLRNVGFWTLLFLFCGMFPSGEAVPTQKISGHDDSALTLDFTQKVMVTTVSVVSAVVCLYIAQMSIPHCAKRLSPSLRR